MEKAVEILKKYWGYDQFRKKQDQIIASVLKGKDTLALLPTGGGKSICYQVPGLLQEGTCLVISPLIALMQDQVDQLKKRGIKAVSISSGMSAREIDIQLDNAVYGHIKFLYVSPERLKTRLFQARFEKMNINLIAVDEAHCISQWGYDFRPAYLEIAAIKKFKPDTPILALTATATPEVVDDIQKRLDFKEQNVFFDSFERSNISYNTYLSNNKVNRMLEYLKDKKDSGIVYCSTRKEVKNICKVLIDHNYSADFYHGGLDAEVRRKKQQSWIDNETRIMVCTNAFGMGIDKPDVRFVLHYDIPETIEAYFQEAGRAGRDGKSSEAWLFYEPADVERLQEKIRLKYPTLESIKKIYNCLGNYFQLAIGSGKEESYPIDMLDFCDHYNLDLITAYNSLKFLEIGGFISLSENINRPSRLHILVDQPTLYQFQVKDNNLNRIIQFLLRTQMGIFEDMVAINERKIAKYTQLSTKQVIQGLSLLEQQDVIDYLPETKGSSVFFVTERLADNNLSLPTEIYHQRKKISFSKMESMVEFLEKNECSNIMLLRYFGENESSACGRCNRCLEKNKLTKSTDLHNDITVYINNKFKSTNEISIEEVIAALGTYKKDDVLQTIRWMTDHDLLHVDRLAQHIKKP
ncbi:MAG: ATP-dependent DNA helicase RecQ [Crocinitomicaceae bacterium]